jgi:hypothetical protein
MKKSISPAQNLFELHLKIIWGRGGKNHKRLLLVCVFVVAVLLIVLTLINWISFKDIIFGLYLKLP